jgi:hypothetical protein
MDDIDTLFIEATQGNKPRKAHKRTAPTSKRIKVRGTIELARDNYRQAKHLHKLNIIKSRTAIKSYKLMTKQAKNNYKLIKLANK